MRISTTTRNLGSHLLGAVVILLSVRQYFGLYPQLYVLGAAYLVSDVIHHMSRATAIADVTTLFLIIGLIVEVVFRMFKEQTNPSTNLHLILMLVSVYVLFAAQPVATCASDADVEYVKHIFVWLTFYAVVTGNTSVIQAVKSSMQPHST